MRSPRRLSAAVGGCFELASAEAAPRTRRGGAVAAPSHLVRAEPGPESSLVSPWALTGGRCAPRSQKGKEFPEAGDLAGVTGGGAQV